MEGTTTLWLFLLLNQLPFCLSKEDRDLSSTLPYSQETEDKGVGSTAAVSSSLTTFVHTNSPDTDDNGTYTNCLIDTEMGLIAVGSAGGLIICLLVATVVLACQVCIIQRRVHASRTTRSNIDLISSTGYWGVDRPGVGGLVGPCDASVMLEEVRADGKMEDERQAEGCEVREEAVARMETGAMAFDVDKAGQMQSSSSKESCLEVPRDLEDMPLVV